MNVVHVVQVARGSFVDTVVEGRYISRERKSMNDIQEVHDEGEDDHSETWIEHDFFVLLGFLERALRETEQKRSLSVAKNALRHTEMNKM